jgi:FkbM family methyltransferase
MMPNYLTETYGLTPATTGKVLCNKLAYSFVRLFGQQPPQGWLESPWHWYKSPFPLRNQILRSRSLGAWFYVEDESTIENMLHMPSYEPVSWVAPMPGNVLIDVGAHIGWYTIQACRAVGRFGKVIALEPDQSNRQQLERNLSLNHIGNYTIVPLAAWSKTESIRWSPSEVSVWNKIDEVKGSETIEAVSLDDVVRRLSVPQVDWIKMDIEGAEVAALEGARETLQRFHPVLFIEVHETLEELKNLLFSIGYSIQRAAFDRPPDHHGWIVAQYR